MSGKTPILAGVVGNPIGHSLSPLIHSVWAARARVNGYYVPVEAPASYEEFAAIIDGLRTVGFAGVNVTLPHKENAFRYATGKSARATAAQAANMLTFTEEGALADNSDISGFGAALKAELKTGEALGPALVLGAGGAARGIILALKELDCKRITLANRTRARAETLAETFSLDHVVDWEDREKELGASHLVVNTTSLGMSGQPPLSLNLSGLSADGIVSDIVYTPLKTPLLKDAARANARSIDGLSMLMHQAAPGFRAWFKGPAEVDSDLRDTLVAALERRARG